MTPAPRGFEGWRVVGLSGLSGLAMSLGNPSEVEGQH